MKRNLEIEKEEKEEIDNEDTKNEEIEIEIENEEIEKEGPIVSLHNRYVHTKTKRNLEIEKEEKGEEIENEEIKKEELEKEEIEKEGLIIKQERIVSLHDQYVHMVKECIRERYTKYYDVLTEDDILEVFVKTLKDSGVPPNIKKDPAYILFQIDFDELEIRRDLNLAALQNHYHAHGGPALNAAAMATPQVFRNWLDGVILNIPGVQANLGQDSFFYPVAAQGPLRDGQEKMLHSIEAVSARFALLERVPWLKENYFITKSANTGPNPVILRSFL